MKPYHLTFRLFIAFTLLACSVSLAGAPLPFPIVAGNAVYQVNGYLVTAPAADENSFYVWSYSRGSTAMDKDPCSGHGKWRMPDMYDFRNMAGWQTFCPWTQDAGRDIHSIQGNRQAWSVAFPAVVYFSSTDRATDSHVWAMYSDGNGKAGYTWDIKSIKRNYIRCVQKETSSIEETIKELIKSISNNE